MRNELTILKENVDMWIKNINKKVSKLQELEVIVDENINNIQHDYELLYELRSKVKHQNRIINILDSRIKILEMRDKIHQLQHEISKINLFMFEAKMLLMRELSKTTEKPKKYRNETTTKPIYLNIS